MFLIIILRSYKDVRNSGADEPIAIEIRKLVFSTFRIWRSMIAGFFLSFIPSRISPSPPGEKWGELDKIQINPRTRFAEWTKEDHQRQMVLLAQTSEALSGEIQYLSERLSDVTKTQHDLLKIHLSLENEEGTDEDTLAINCHGVVQPNGATCGEAVFVCGVDTVYPELMARWIKGVYGATT
jgi:hypothetical protein